MEIDEALKPLNCSTRAERSRKNREENERGASEGEMRRACAASSRKSISLLVCHSLSFFPDEWEEEGPPHAAKKIHIKVKRGKPDWGGSVRRVGYGESTRGEKSGRRGEPKRKGERKGEREAPAASLRAFYSSSRVQAPP